jgi:AraC-like DNA-binding protein
MMTEDISDPPNLNPSGTGFVRDPSRPILAHGRIFRPGASVRPHSHPRAQLLWAAEGVLRVTGNGSVWIVPPSHAVWIAADTQHAVSSETEAQIRNLYFDPSLHLRAQDACAVLLLTPLMRQLILRLGVQDMSQAFDRRLQNLCAVIRDEVEALVPAPLSLPGGQDPRLVRLTRHLGAAPADPRGLQALAAFVGASPRTLERLFRSETGLTFRQWRARLRLLAAIERLNLGQSSTSIAYALGYRSVSAFVAAFHDQFGCPPQSFLQQRG